jgi:WhiB family redox-sensing transcriptional regulator
MTGIHDWMAEAECRYHDPETFFPPMGGTTRWAKAVCADCPVVAECLAYAQAYESQPWVHSRSGGVYGGLTPDERLRIRQGRPDRPLRGH